MDVIETVDEHCTHKDCIYRMRFGLGSEFCAFMLVESVPRGCPISRCTRYKSGSKKVVIDKATLSYRWILNEDEDY